MPSPPSVESLLRSLVQCPSVNPGAGNTDPEIRGESRMVALLETILRPWADAIKLQPVAPGRANLIARFDGADTSKRFALEAHTDTVGVAGMSIDPFAATVQDGKLHGRGACDTKGPMTAMLLALMDAKQQTAKLPHTWFFVATCDEENGGSGARALTENGFRCDGMIVGEPTDLNALQAHKGVVRYELTVTGKAAHSAYPEMGVHAIHAAAEIITHACSAANQPGFSGGDHPLGPPSLSFGTIRGGDLVNRIPDRVVLEIDCRLVPGQPASAFRELLESAVHTVARKYPGLSGNLVQTQSYPAFEYRRRGAFSQGIDALVRTCNRDYSTARYTTNAGFYDQAGIPAVVFGPGSIEQAHTADEWIALEEIETARKALSNLILDRD